MKSINPGKQRKRYFKAPQHKKRKAISSHLEENLILKYDKRAVPVIKGDTVKVMRGSFKGHEDKVASVNVKKQIINIERITLTKTDGNKIPKPINASNVLITKLNLTDKWRRNKLERGLSEEAKKEIEKEAEAQIKEQEEEQKRLEEEKRLAEEQEEKEEAVEETVEDKPKEDKEKQAKKEPVKKETEEKTSPKKSTTKKQTSKKPQAKKQSTSKKTSTPKKKTTTKKTTSKKTTPKKSTKKEEK